MGKGAGKGSGGAGGALDAAVRAVNRLGVANAEYLREGMRSLAAAAGAFAGASPTEATRIATGAAPARNTGRDLPPITVVVDGGDVILRDGRHRMTAARAAGATKIRATVVTYHNGRAVERIANVALKAKR